MKKSWLLGSMVAVLMLAGPAFALSVEQGPVNSDGTAKFSDPDEQTPQGLVSPDSGSSHFSAGVTQQPYMGSPYTPQVMGMDQGQNAFDNAYNHVANQH